MSLEYAAVLYDVLMDRNEEMPFLSHAAVPVLFEDGCEGLFGQSYQLPPDVLLWDEDGEPHQENLERIALATCGAARAVAETLEGVTPIYG